MASVRFFLLDVNSEVVNGRPEVRLWGLNDDGETTLIRVTDFNYYFYLLPEEGANVEEVVKEIRKPSLEKIIDAQVVKRKYFGRHFNAVKVILSDADAAGGYARELKKIKGVAAILEDDIRLAMRYLIDNEVLPCRWHSIDAEPSDPGDINVAKAYLAKGKPEPLSKAEVPKLKIMAFTIVPISDRGSPRPSKDPVAIIAVASNDGVSKAIVMQASDDRRVIREFVEFVNEYDPDVIVGYGSNRAAWPYLTERFKGVLEVDRTRSGPHTSVFGHVSITGRVNVDLLDLAEDIQEVKIKSLDNIAVFFGIIPQAREGLIREFEVARYWKEPELRKRLIKQAVEDAQLILKLAEVNMDFIMELSSLTGLPPDQALAAAVGFRVDSYLIREAFKAGELIPPRSEQPYIPYRGALVLEPKQGLHENVAVLDLASMYPNLMILYNISPDTLVRPGQEVHENNITVIPEVNHRFLKQPSGFYKNALTSLLWARSRIKEQLQRVSPNSSEERILKAQEKAVKVITNALYGYAGWIGARWYVREVAEAVTALGRQTILRVIDMARGLGLEVVYGDTDSIFIKHEEQKVDKLLSDVKGSLNMDIRPEKVYVRVLFTEAKKRYAGLLPDGRMEAVGFEAVRGDWSEVAKKVQERVMEIILMGGSPLEAVEYVRGVVGDLKDGRVPLEDLIIWKTLTKPIEEYEVRAPHVEVARKLMAEGWSLSTGDKVGYVITKGKGKLHERAAPFFSVALQDVDGDYYLRNQVLPAALRILEAFGITEAQVLAGAPREGFKRFFRLEPP